MKRNLFALLSALVLAVSLTGCSFSDLMLYLYGGDEWLDEEKEPVWITCDADNGVSVVYDGNLWESPMMPQEDTVSLTAGNQLDYTAVLMQRTDAYTDFLAQSGAELAETTNVVEYAMDFTVPQAQVEAVRYDCGSYQTIFAQIDYDCGETIYITAATRSSDYEPILDLLQRVYPTGHAPEETAALDSAQVDAYAGDGGRQQSYA